MARWLRWSQTTRELELEHTIRTRFDHLVGARPAPPYHFTIDPSGRVEQNVQLVSGELTGGAFIPGRGMVPLDDPEVLARYPMFHETATAPTVLAYHPPGPNLLAPMFPDVARFSIPEDAPVVMLPDDTECPSDRFLVTCVPCGQRFAVATAIRDSRELVKLGHGLGCRGRS